MSAVPDTAIPAAPRVFISYSHDSEAHKAWVLQLATRLVRNGVDVILDRWDLTLGSDLPRFMENGLTSSQRVIAVCTSAYVTKANDGKGGVGYEKMILTAQLMQNVTSDRIIPLVRDNTLDNKLPTFLGARVYCDFGSDPNFEEKYAELIREIHGQAILPRPSMGANPFAHAEPARPVRLSTQPDRYVSPGLSGVVEFDYSNNDGIYVIGAGDMSFETSWTSCSTEAIHAYKHGGSVIALASGVGAIKEISDADKFDSSSRARTPRVGEVLVLRNLAGYYAAIKILAVAVRNSGSMEDRLSFWYVIEPTRSSSFANVNDDYG